MDRALQIKIPTLISLSRIFAVPLILAIYFNFGVTGQVGAALLFALAALTDYFDGYLARKWNAVSNYGKFMDPVADKILVSSTLIILIAKSILDPLSVLIIIARDTFIGGIRAIAAADQIIIAAKPAGKWKAALQMVAIPILMTKEVIGADSLLFKAAYLTLWLSVILSLTSAFDYYRGYKLASQEEAK